MSLGHKQVTEYEINQIVGRLYYVPMVSRSSTELRSHSSNSDRFKQRKTPSRVDIDNMVSTVY